MALTPKQAKNAGWGLAGTVANNAALPAVTATMVKNAVRYWVLDLNGTGQAGAVFAVAVGAAGTDSCWSLVG
jgi:hypothetical protein